MLKNKKLENKLSIIDRRCCEALAENIELKEQLRLLQESYENQKNINDDLQNVYNETRRLKHDIRNHLLVIASYLNEEKNAEAKIYVSEIIDKMELDYSYISSGNSLLNYLLNEKFMLAKQFGVYIKADIENLSFKSVSGIDFAAILGNLLDNAFEASLKSTEKQMCIQVKSKMGYEAIKVSNSIDTSVLENNPFFETTKNDLENHGIGLKQVKSLVQKYKGILDCWEEHKMFHVQILFEKE